MLVLLYTLYQSKHQSWEGQQWQLDTDNQLLWFAVFFFLCCLWNWNNRNVVAFGKADFRSWLSIYRMMPKSAVVSNCCQRVNAGRVTHWTSSQSQIVRKIRHATIRTHLWNSLNCRQSLERTRHKSTRTLVTFNHLAFMSHSSHLLPAPVNLQDDRDP